MSGEEWEGVLHVSFPSPLPPPVSSCLRDLRSEALVFMAGIVKHITTVAVIQQCSSTNLLKQP